MRGIHISYKFLVGFDKIFILFDLATAICRFPRKIFGNKDLVGTRGTLAGFGRIERAQMVSVCAFCGLGQGCTSRGAVFDCGKRRGFRHLLLERRFPTNEPFNAPRLPSRPFLIRALFSFRQRFSIPYNRDWLKTCQMVTFLCPSTAHHQHDLSGGRALPDASLVRAEAIL